MPSFGMNVKAVNKIDISQGDDKSKTMKPSNQPFQKETHMHACLYFFDSDETVKDAHCVLVRLFLI